MSERRHLRDLPTFCFAFVGLIAGHLLSYLIAIPDAARRDAVLAESGHTYLHLAGDVAIVLAFAAVVTVGLRAAAGPGRYEVRRSCRPASASPGVSARFRRVPSSRWSSASDS